MTAQGGNRTVLLARKMGGVTIADVMRDRECDMRTALQHLRSVTGAGKLVRSGGGPGEAFRWHAAQGSMVPGEAQIKPAKPAPCKPGPKPLPPPTMPERAEAAQAARTLRELIDNPDPAAWGAVSTVHIDSSRPRRAEWVTMWANLPGFSRVNGAYSHRCLPGWTYTRAEVTAEMIPDLEALAEHGVRPTEATR